MLTFIILVIIVALIFDFLNGFHDAANSIATIVSTRVLTPFQAVAWAAFFNFIAAFVFGTEVAKTIGTGLVKVELIDVYVVMGGLLGAILWNLLTWWLGLPTSSSHALVAGIAGAAVAKAGVGVLIAKGWALVLLGIVLSPGLGFLLGSMLASDWGGDDLVGGADGFDTAGGEGGDGGGDAGGDGGGFDDGGGGSDFGDGGGFDGGGFDFGGGDFGF